MNENLPHCTLCHSQINGPAKKSTNKIWIYHAECYKKILDRPIEWYKERTKFTNQWDYLFPDIDPHRRLNKY